MLDLFEEWEKTPTVGPKPDVVNDPLVCLDDTYFISERVGRLSGDALVSEYLEGPPDGAWANVGIFLRWQPDLLEEAKAFQKKLMGLKSNSKIPPYLVLHIRRGDQQPGKCKDFLATVDDVQCDQPSRYLDAIEEVRREAVEKGLIKEGQKVTTLLMTDETNRDFLQYFSDRGLLVTDHDALKTVEETGDPWRPTLWDAVLMGEATGFVGYGGSTMSVLAARRVADWHGGPFRLVSRQWS